MTRQLKSGFAPTFAGGVPELSDLLGRKHDPDGILTQDLIWAGLSRAGVAAGRVLHQRLVGKSATDDACKQAGWGATDVLTAELAARGVEGDTVFRGRLWTVLVRAERGAVAVTMAFEDLGGHTPRIEYTAAVLFAGIRLGMSYQTRPAS